MEEAATWRMDTEQYSLWFRLVCLSLLGWLMAPVVKAQGPPTCSGLSTTTLTSITVCSGRVVDSLEVNAAGLSTEVIEFVRFDTLYANPYIGNDRVHLGESLPVAGKVTLKNVRFPEYFGEPDRTYYVYALLKQEPADPACRPFALIKVFIRSSPMDALIIREATCYGSVTQQDGLVAITDYKPTDTYEMAKQGTFSGQAQPIPAGGILVDGLSRSGIPKTYSVRIYNSLGCYSDRSITMMNTPCDCPPVPCVPIRIVRTKTHRLLR